MSVPHLACMALVAAAHGLPPRVLPAIQAVEGGRVGTVSPNRNGTEDLGVMQVNTVWLPALARRSGLPEAEVRRRLVEQPCFNVAAAGLILRAHLDETRDLLRAVGNYHSRTPALHLAYRARVTAAATRLFVVPPAGPR